MFSVAAHGALMQNLWCSPRRPAYPNSLDWLLLLLPEVLSGMPAGVRDEGMMPATSALSA